MTPTNQTLPMTPTDPLSPSPVPSTAPASSRATSLTVLDNDAAIAHLIITILGRSGLPDAELARRMGLKKASLAQYKYGYRSHPSARWLARLVQAAGGRLVVEFK